nr:MAG TPA: hypothetical protein [Caudoviricetes sp.]
MSPLTDGIYFPYRKGYFSSSLNVISLFRTIKKTVCRTYSLN